MCARGAPEGETNGDNRPHGRGLIETERDWIRSAHLGGGGVPEPKFFKLLRSPRIDSKEPIPPGCEAWRAGTTTLFLLGS
jgi:hypothetical protein